MLLQKGKKKFAVIVGAGTGVAVGTATGAAAGTGTVAAVTGTSVAAGSAVSKKAKVMVVPTVEKAMTRNKKYSS